MKFSIFKSRHTLEQKVSELENASGLSIDTITQLFLKGYKLRPGSVGAVFTEFADAVKHLADGVAGEEEVNDD